MTPLATVLLIDEQRRLEPAFRAALEGEPGLRLLVTTNPLVGRALAREEKPDLVAVGGPTAENGPGRLGDPAGAGPTAAPPLLVKVTWSDASAPAVAEAAPGFDEHLVLPLKPSELHARLLEMLHLKRAYDRLRADELELKRLQEALVQRRDQLLQVLLTLLDMGLPGAAARRRRRWRCGSPSAWTFPSGCGATSSSPRACTSWVAWSPGTGSGSTESAARRASRGSMRSSPAACSSRWMPSPAPPR
jgi:DNA-binding response OmpR family regulator